ncbi:MAG: hypothetical protein WAQ27_01255 [Candidatus Microsaccharimonas sp.]
MNKQSLKKLGKNTVALKELRRAHFMIILLALAVAALAFINSAGVTTINGVVLFVLVALALLIAITSALVFVNIPRSK